MWPHLGLGVAGDEALELGGSARAGDERRAGGGGFERGGARVFEERKLTDGVALVGVGPRVGLGSWGRDGHSGGWARAPGGRACSHGAAGVCNHRVERDRLEEMVERALADGHDEPGRPAEDPTAGGARR